MAFKSSLSMEVYINIFLLIMCSLGVFLHKVLELPMFTVSHENAALKTEVQFPYQENKEL